MASFKKSLEGLKNTTQSATKGVTDSAGTNVQAAQDAMQQVAESSKETTSAAAEEASRQTQSAIGTAAEKKDFISVELLIILYSKVCSKMLVL
uniref:Si:ch211-59p23.1 n=1 Tax=Sinocyclocheilus anshuiensis TaxID=1608454 RepID=A0A671SBI0_9TELE